MHATKKILTTSHPHSHSDYITFTTISVAIPASVAALRTDDDLANQTIFAPALNDNPLSIDLDRNTDASSQDSCAQEPSSSSSSSNKRRRDKQGPKTSAKRRTQTPPLPSPAPTPAPIPAPTPAPPEAQFHHYPADPKVISIHTRN